MTLENEAEEYADSLILTLEGEHYPGLLSGFIAGANSNYAKQQVIKGKIEALREVLDSDCDDIYDYIYKKIKALKTELKQLEKL